MGLCCQNIVSHHTVGNKNANLRNMAYFIAPVDAVHVNETTTTTLSVRFKSTTFPSYLQGQILGIEPYRDVSNLPPKMLQVYKDGLKIERYAFYY